MVICEVKPHKEDPNRTRITAAGSQICYPWDVGTPTISIDLIKLIINSVLYRRNARFVSFDLKNFYLQTPMDRSKYVRIKFSDIPLEFIEEYDLSEASKNGWIYFLNPPRLLWLTTIRPTFQRPPAHPSREGRIL